MPIPRLAFTCLLIVSAIMPAIRTSAQELDPKQQVGIKIIHPDAKDAESFIRSHHVVIGVWGEFKVNDGDAGVTGHLHYPVYNDSFDLTFMSTFNVLKPTNKEALAALSGRNSLLLIQSGEQAGWWEVAGFAAPLPDKPGRNWLPTARSLDYSESFTQKKYRYEHLIDENIALLDDADGQARARALGLLAQIGVDAAAAIKPIRKLLESKHESDRSGAIVALGSIGGQDAAAGIPRIIELLSDDPKLKRVAIPCLASFGKRATKALPLIIKTLKEADQDKAPEINYIIEALGRIEHRDPAVIEALTPYLKHRFGTVRVTAQKALQGEFAEKVAHPIG